MTEEVKKAPDSSFKTRVKSAVILAPAVLLLLYLGGRGFAFLMAAAAGIGAYEWARMVLKGQDNVPKNLYHVAAFMTGLGVVTAAMFGSPLGALLFLLALCFTIFAYNFSAKGPSAKLLIFGVVYIGFSCQIMVWLRDGDSAVGLYNVMTLLFIVWASDIFAYLSGKSIGGPKLAPAISPKKTWAGLIGGSVGSGAVAAALALPATVDFLGVATLGGMGVVGYFIMGFILSVVGQAGDLFISLFKRKYDVKDTGTLIPGHGGILDRIDALLLVAIFFGIIARVTGA